MIVNIWRYCHFALAISSSLFVLLATITGLVLALEPIHTQLQPHKVANGEEQSVSELIRLMTAQYEEIIAIEVDANYFVKASVISMDEEKDGDFYIHPITGEKLADIPDKHPFFEWTTNLHRSLFLKTIGRIFVGITSFLLFLITLTGCILLIKRQKGIIQFFSKIIKEDFWQYYHVVLGRLMLIPILIITMSGVYLSFLRFSLIPESEAYEIVNEYEETDPETIPFHEFPIFQSTKLKDIRSLEFPFSDDEDETFILALKDREIQINQKTAEVKTETIFPFVKILNEWSFNLHTGNGSIIWSLILLFASGNILFFMYSGGMISYKRIRSKVKNLHTADVAEIVILVGTENGSTRDFAAVLQKSFHRIGKKVFLDDLNNYQKFPCIEHLIILTSTYGVGDPPANAKRFLTLFEQIKPENTFNYAVVGFGSKVYPDFCQYALDIDEQLRTKTFANPLTPVFLINNKSYARFKYWALEWSEKAGLQLDLPANLERKKEKLYSFEIIDKRIVKDAYDETFILKLKTPPNLVFQSGDLLAIFPPEDDVERLYSIGKDTKGNILLSIKRHELGVCSNYLNELNTGSILEAVHRSNPSFHIPKQTTSLVLVANGTGMAPFLGMVHEKPNVPVQLYWGGRTSQSYQIYESYLNTAFEVNNRVDVHTVFSKEGEKFKYVQDLLKLEGMQIVSHLDTNGTIMICGSVAMQNDVLALLNSLTQTHLQKELEYFLEKEQILMDCY